MTPIFLVTNPISYTDLFCKHEQSQDAIMQ